MTVIDAPPHDPLPPTLESATAPAPASRRRRWPARLWRGRPEDPAWVRPALLALLAGTAVLYLWGLSDSGWANSYYSAAVQAGTKSWKAFLFGSTDASNFITVDKTPASLWPGVFAARVFGLSSWSILVPQAIEGVAAVGVLYLTVRRWFGAPAGLLAGLIFATTPASALIFRYNNPDALLVLCLVVGAYGVTRAIEDGRTRWLVLAGASVGFAFLAKELQAFLVLPGFAAGYLLAGPGTWWRRVRGLVEMGIAMIVAAGWFVAILVLTPATSRPYIGGSQNNSFWNVLFGYNGLGRLTGDETGSVGGGPQAAGGRWGPTGLTRLFNGSFGDGASWLLPAALFLLVVGLVVTARTARTDRTRAALVVWGGWLLVTGLAFSLGEGIIHEYYTVALGPAIGAVVAIGATALWRRRAEAWSRVASAIALGSAVWWTVTLLDRSPQWHPGLGKVLVGVAIVVGVALVAGSTRRGVLTATAVAAVLIATAGPVAASVTTARTAHEGPLPTVGPVVTDGGRFGNRVRALPGAGAFPGGGQVPGAGGFPGGGQAPGAGGFPGGGQAPGAGGFPGGGQAPGAGGGGMRGGVFGSPEPPAAVTRVLRQARTNGERWAAATIGATNAAGYQLASGAPIMAIGGFNGSDPTPTLAEFQALVREGQIRYYLTGSSGIPGGGGASGGSAITAWVEQTFRSRVVAGVTLYDLTEPADSGAVSGAGTV